MAIEYYWCTSIIQIQRNEQLMKFQNKSNQMNFIFSGAFIHIFLRAVIQICLVAGVFPFKKAFNHKINGAHSFVPSSWIAAFAIRILCHLFLSISPKNKAHICGIFALHVCVCVWWLFYVKASILCLGRDKWLFGSDARAHM